jgi:AraC-like DNA-binding protein
MIFELNKPLLIAGALQGLLLGFFIYKKGNNESGLKFLAMAIFLASLNTFLFSIEDLHEFLGCPLCNLLTRLTFFLFGPLVFLFIHYKTQSRKPTVHLSVHFIPFIMLSVLSFFAYKDTQLAQNEIVRMFLPIHFNTTYFYEILRIAHITLYGILSYRLLITSNRLKRKEQIWLKQFVIFAVAAYCLIAITLKLNYYTANPKINEFHLLFLVIPLFIYFTTYKVLNWEDFKLDAFQTLKYKKTKLKDPKTIARNLEILVQSQKIYLEPNVSLSFIAKELKISRHQLSQFLNAEMNVKFNDYINQLRIEEAKVLIEQTSDELTLAAIGMNVGFRSKTTFISAFKKHVKMTPSEYRNRICLA